MPKTATAAKFVLWSFKKAKHVAKRKTNEKKLCEKLTFRSVPTPRATRIVDCPPCQPHIAAVPLLSHRCLCARGRGPSLARSECVRASETVCALMHAGPFTEGGFWTWAQRYKSEPLPGSEHHSLYSQQQGNNATHEQEFSCELRT